MKSTIPSVPRHDAILHVEALYFDGQTAAARKVFLTLEEATNRLHIHADGRDISWPLDAIRQLPDQAGDQDVVLRLAHDPTARLITGDKALVARFPARHRRTIDAPRGRLARWAVAAVGSVALIVFVLVPLMADQLATFIPPKGEKALGDATLRQIQKALGKDNPVQVRSCSNPAGLHALSNMQASLARYVDAPFPLTVTVLDHPMVNAFALPGGNIVMMRGLLAQAQSADEVAAVFAHEMGHVVSRDPTRHALRSAGSIGVLGLMFGDFAGGALVLFLTEQLIQAHYSQDAEAAADTFAHGILARAGVPPSALGAMFDRLQKKNGDAQGIVAHFQSHPQMVQRIKMARAATPDGFVPRPILTQQEWQDLKTLCEK